MESLHTFHEVKSVLSIHKFYFPDQVMDYKEFYVGGVCQTLLHKFHVCLYQSIISSLQEA
jgi:hypothetical protein